MTTTDHAAVVAERENKKKNCNHKDHKDHKGKTRRISKKRAVGADAWRPFFIDFFFSSFVLFVVFVVKLFFLCG